MRVLTWNLFHGRAVPGARRDLQDDFAAALAGWDWDVALLQEVPPWWPPVLARACQAHERTAPTSRNALLPARRWVARRWPDVIKANGGGANAILVRGQAPDGHRVAPLRRWPERRVVHAVRLAGGVWAANLHAQVRPRRAARADITRAAEIVHGWRTAAPALLGGDFNVPEPAPPGFVRLGGRGVDHVCAAGFAPGGDARAPARGGLSDHAPVVVVVEPRMAPVA